MSSNNAPTITPDEFKERRDDAVVIDVRTAGEVAGGRVAGAEHIDVQQPDFRERIDALDRDKTYLLYCRSGNRSGMATRIMREAGFENAYNAGGIGTLAKAGVEVE